jgi:phosphatidylglycerophosphate synthase
MSKLNKADKFLDLSDYGRPVAKWMVAMFKNTSVTPIQVTYLFGISGCIAVVCILAKYYLAAAFFLILKSILDAADGELSRVKNTPSYVGRYVDSIFDILLNAMILWAIMHIVHASLWITILAFICVQMQGTLYNYYYVILRNKLQGGDSTSKIFEYKEPIAFAGESQKAVHITYTIFNVLYSFFDKSIHLLDKNAYKEKQMPSWFMTMVSCYGLGFQLLIIAVLLPVGLAKIILPFFVVYTILLFVFIGIRKYIL